MKITAHIFLIENLKLIWSAFKILIYIEILALFTSDIDTHRKIARRLFKNTLRHQ